MEQNNQLQIFKNLEFGELKVIIKDGENWFVAKDISQVLDYTKTANMVERLDADEKIKLNYTDSVSIGLENVNSQGMYIINESGLYSAILGSKKKEAKKFKKWVTSEVLPSIRKHGAYMTEDTIEKALTSPDFLIQLATKLKEEQQARKLAEEKNKVQEKVIENLTPQAIIGDRFTNDNNVYDMARFCKILDIRSLGRNNMFKYLRNNNILRYNNEPYQQYMKYFKVVMITNSFNDKKTPKTLVKSKGINFIVKRLIKDGYIITKSVDEILDELENEN